MLVGSGLYSFGSLASTYASSLAKLSLFRCAVAFSTASRARHTLAGSAVPMGTSVMISLAAGGTTRRAMKLSVSSSMPDGAIATTRSIAVEMASRYCDTDGFDASSPDGTQSQGATSSGIASMHAFIAVRARRWLASYRTNPSVSLAIRNASSSMLCPSTVTFTGAEKPRKSDGTGLEATFEKVYVVSASWKRSTNSGPSMVVASPPSVDTVTDGIGAPVDESRRLVATGIISGFFDSDGCPGVLGVVCFNVSVYVFAASSYDDEHVTAGVPACAYQFKKFGRSFPPFAASTIAW
mmetsp:Transcript_4306/g.9743  ORF Transcript_4306/g.9743 Transcript_4306/m.9743 type:complete len:295 (-) Transcript_4306:936-1820(-)